MCFIDHFSELDDPRKDINIKYDFLDIVFLTVCAVVSGAEGWKDIKQFGDEKLEWLRQYRAYENGIPADDTIARIIYSTYFKMHPPIQQKARTVSLSLSLPVHLEVY